MLRLTGTNTLSVVTLPQETVDTTHWECEACLGRTAVINGVSLRLMKFEVKNASFGAKEARQRR